MVEIIQKNGVKLTSTELDQVNRAKAREFEVPPMEKEQVENSVFFLLKKDEDILAIGQLSKIEPISFDNVNYSVMGIGGIIANERGKGYGKQIMQTITKHLINNNKTGVGFCETHNKGFYEKAGYKVDTSLIKRFVFSRNGKEEINTDDDCVLYLDASDNFVKNVLSKPNEKVNLPQPPDW